jgi:hypothetical protein
MVPLPALILMPTIQDLKDKWRVLTNAPQNSYTQGASRPIDHSHHAQHEAELRIQAAARYQRMLDPASDVPGPAASTGKRGREGE